MKPAELEPAAISGEELSALRTLRAANRALVERYLAIRGAENYERRCALLAEDVMYEIVFTMDLLPERVCGLNKVRRRFEDNALVWDEFEYSNITVYELDRSDTFLVRCDADGTIVNPMFKKELLPRHYHNHYFIMFVIREGKIWQLRQFTNPQKLIHDFWKDVPNSVG